MHPQYQDIDFEKVLLSHSEKKRLRSIIRKKQVSAETYTPEQIEPLEQYGLICVNRNHETNLGFGIKSVITQGEPVSVTATDNATRYFIYRKEAFFKGKLPVILSIIALIKAFDREILWIFHFICDWISNL